MYVVLYENKIKLLKEDVLSVSGYSSGHKSIAAYMVFNNPDEAATFATIQGGVVIRAAEVVNSVKEEE